MMDGYGEFRWKDGVFIKVKNYITYIFLNNKVIGIVIIDVDKESSKSKMEIIIKVDRNINLLINFIKIQVNGGKIKGRDRDYKGIIMVMFIEVGTYLFPILIIVGQWKND